MPTDHAIFSPSGASRWLRCPGSPLLIQRLREQGLLGDEPPHPAAVHGTRAHALAERMILEDLSLEDALGPMPDWSLAEVRPYVELVRRTIAEADEWAVEQRLSIFEPHCFGTADFIARRDRHGVVADLKYGLGPVRARWNPQLMLYGYGLLQRWPDLERLTFSIVQPRVKSVPLPDTWTVDATEVQAFGERACDIIKEALELWPDQVLIRPSRQACEWCLAADLCPKRRSTT